MYEPRLKGYTLRLKSVARQCSLLLTRGYRSILATRTLSQ